MYEVLFLSFTFLVFFFFKISYLINYAAYPENIPRGHIIDESTKLRTRSGPDLFKLRHKLNIISASTFTHKLPSVQFLYILATEINDSMSNNFISKIYKAEIFTVRLRSQRDGKSRSSDRINWSLEHPRTRMTVFEFGQDRDRIYYEIETRKRPDQKIKDPFIIDLFFKQLC